MGKLTPGQLRENTSAAGTGGGGLIVRPSTTSEGAMNEAVSWAGLILLPSTIA